MSNVAYVANPKAELQSDGLFTCGYGVDSKQAARNLSRPTLQR
jgi:hypoxanthine-guanine phosphoribosyltransferase